MINNAAGLPPFEGPITVNPDTGEQYTVTIPFLGVDGIGDAPTSDCGKPRAADGKTATLAPTSTREPRLPGLRELLLGRPAQPGTAG